MKVLLIIQYLSSEKKKAGNHQKLNHYNPQCNFPIIYYYLLPSVRPIPALTIRCRSFPLKRFMKEKSRPVLVNSDLQSREVSAS